VESITRRELLQLAGAPSAALAVLPKLSASHSRSGRYVKAPLAVFDYSQVELLDGPLRRQFDENHNFFLRLDDDRML